MRITARKSYYITLNALPVLFMIGLIPLIQDDLLLAGIYLVIAALSLRWFKEPRDVLAFGLGLILMTFAEYVFISTGVEVFQRHSLFSIMPLWLPVLWGYGFVAIKRATEILDGRYRLTGGRRI